MAETEPLGEVLFEFTRLGNVVQLSALHVESNTEVSIMGPAGASQAALRHTALQKLRYVLAKRGDQVK
jgi:hypothetical protein